MMNEQINQGFPVDKDNNVHFLLPEKNRYRKNDRGGASRSYSDAEDNIQRERKQKAVKKMRMTTIVGK